METYTYTTNTLAMAGKDIGKCVNKSEKTYHIYSHTHTNRHTG